MDKLYGLIFDVDGVIADTEAANARASIKVFADYLGLEGVVRKDFEAGLGRGAEEYVKAGARTHGMELTDEQIDQKRKIMTNARMARLWVLEVSDTPRLHQ